MVAPDWGGVREAVNAIKGECNPLRRLGERGFLRKIGAAGALRP